MLLGISGSLRKASINTQLVRTAAQIYAPDRFEEASLRFPLYDGDLEAADGVPSEVAAVGAQIQAAEAVVISTPEYNQSFPGVLKNGLDWISRLPTPVWRDKPVAILSATAGRAGGARAAYALRLAMMPFRARVLPGPEVLVAGGESAFEDGQLEPGRAREQLEELMAELKRIA